MHEQTMAAKEAKNHFGELLDRAQRKPITITKKNRPVVIVISIQEYQQLKAKTKAVKHTDFKMWLGFANEKPLNPTPRFKSEDDLWD